MWWGKNNVMVICELHVQTGSIMNESLVLINGQRFFLSERMFKWCLTVFDFQKSMLSEFVMQRWVFRIVESFFSMQNQTLVLLIGMHCCRSARGNSDGNWTAGYIPVCSDVSQYLPGLLMHHHFIRAVAGTLTFRYLPVPNEEIWCSPPLNTWKTTVSFINYNKCDGILSHSRNKVRLALWGCHWLDTSGDTADDGQHSMLGWTASSL